MHKSYFYFTFKNVSIIFFEIFKLCLIVHTTCEFYDEIMKKAKGNLYRNFHMNKLSMNSLVQKREK
jgi:hypothetical protein